MSYLNNILFLFDDGIYYLENENSLESNPVKKEKSYNIHIDSSSFTLIPEQIFKNINPLEIHSYLDKNENEFSFQETFLPKENAYLVWTIKKNKLVELESLYPASNLLHFSTFLLNDNHYNDEIRFFKTERFIYISAVKNQKLQLVNRFEINGLDDILYFILSVIKEADLINSQFRIVELGIIDGEVENRLKSIFHIEETDLYILKPFKLMQL